METLPTGEKKVNLYELWSAIGGGTKFSHDEVVTMAFNQQKQRRPFFVQHRDYRFIVTLEDLDLYFRENPLPEAAKTLEERIATLTKERDDLKMENALLRDQIQQASQPVPEKIGGPIEEIRRASTPAERPAPQDLGLPIGEEEKVPFSKIQDELKNELKAKGVKAVSSRTPFEPKARTLPPPAPVEEPETL